jgi:hypothetical protein
VTNLCPELRFASIHSRGNTAVFCSVQFLTSGSICAQCARHDSGETYCHCDKRSDLIDVGKHGKLSNDVGADDGVDGLISLLSALAEKR